MHIRQIKFYTNRIHSDLNSYAFTSYLISDPHESFINSRLLDTIETENRLYNTGCDVHCAITTKFILQYIVLYIFKIRQM